MNQEYFSFELTPNIDLGIPLADMVTAAQFEKSNTCTVPGVANFWHGVVNFKGSLLWVLDSQLFFRAQGTQNKHWRKITTVILRSHQSIAQQQVAMATPKLKGIVSLESTALQPLTDQASSVLNDCCSAMVSQDQQQLMIVDVPMLLQNLHQQSSLVTA